MNRFPTLYSHQSGHTFVAMATTNHADDGGLMLIGIRAFMTQTHVVMT